MSTRYKFLTIMCLFISPMNYAGTEGSKTRQTQAADESSPCANAYVATLSVGPTWTNIGRTQTFFLQPDISATYLADQNVKTHIAGELFIGMQQFIEEGLSSQIGFAFGSTQHDLQGTILEDANPTFNNFSYHYVIHNTRFAFKGKINANIVYDFQAYLSASVGAAVNRSRDFVALRRLEEAVAPPTFAANTDVTFAYTLGIGAQHYITKNLQLGLGYDFTDWGRNTLARASGQTVNNGLGLSHLYTNQLQISLSLFT